MPDDYPPVDELAGQLAAFVGASMATSSGDAEFVAQCASEAVDWLDLKLAEFSAAYPARPLPPASAYTRAVLEVGSQLFRRRRSWTTIEQLETPASPPVRSDPFSAAYPILRPWIGPVMA